MSANNRISMGAGHSTPRCPSCPSFQSSATGWGWCQDSRNRVFSDGWPLGFTPSMSPSGTCDLHPERVAITKAEQESPNA